MFPSKLHAIHLVLGLALAGCSTTGGAKGIDLYAPPTAADASSTAQQLINLPYPAQPISVAVYGFSDQTGQFDPTVNSQTLSRAVTQGATSVLIQALRQTGHGRWFTVLERENLDSLLKERQVITEMRQRYLGERNVNAEALPSLLFAGVLLEGGIIGYDSDTLTGGAGARLLGIGVNASYRQDTITIYLRAVATKTGEVVASVVARKTVVSAGLQGGAFRYVSYKNLLETETGFTVNEPRTIALEQAVEKATYDLILEGARQGIWGFYDQAAAAPLMARHLADRGGSSPLSALARSSSPAPASASLPASAQNLTMAAAPTPVPETPAAQMIRSTAAQPAFTGVTASQLRPPPQAPSRVAVVTQYVSTPNLSSAAVQIGAYNSAAEAVEAWNQVSELFPAFVESKVRLVEPVQSGGRTLYRTLVAGFDNRAKAQSFCSTLKFSGRDCLVKARAIADTSLANMVNASTPGS